MEPKYALSEAAAGNGTVVDVREEAEVADVSLRADGVLCVPTSQLEVVPFAADAQAALAAAGFPAEVGTAQNPAWVMCRAGRRGQLVAEILKSLGRTHVANLTGGILNCDPSMTK